MILTLLLPSSIHVPQAHDSTSLGFPFLACQMMLVYRGSLSHSKTFHSKKSSLGLLFSNWNSLVFNRFSKKSYFLDSGSLDSPRWAILKHVALDEVAPGASGKAAALDIILMATKMLSVLCNCNKGNSLVNTSRYSVFLSVQNFLCRNGHILFQFT